MDSTIIWDLEDDVEEETEEDMKSRRLFRPSGKTPQEQLREKTLREKLQMERLSLEDLVRTGACDPDAIMTMGMYFDIQRVTSQ